MFQEQLKTVGSSRLLTLTFNGERFPDMNGKIAPTMSDAARAFTRHIERTNPEAILLDLSGLNVWELFDTSSSVVMLCCVAAMRLRAGMRYAIVLSEPYLVEKFYVMKMDLAMAYGLSAAELEARIDQWPVRGERAWQ